MMKVNVAICEDNLLIQNQLKDIIIEYYTEKNFEISVDLFSNGNDFLSNLANKNYTFVLMDIDLEESNGVEVAQRFRELIKSPIPVVFVTSYEEYKSIVFPIHIFYYLVKPFNKRDIITLLDELSSWIGFDEHKESKRIPFKTLSGLIYIMVGDIHYFEYKDRKIEIVLENNKYTMYGSLREIKDQLSEYHFYYPHSAFIINLDKIKNITRERSIIMENGYEIPISQTRVKEFKKVYFEYIDSKD